MFTIFDKRKYHLFGLALNAVSVANILCSIQTRIVWVLLSRFLLSHLIVCVCFSSGWHYVFSQPFFLHSLSYSYSFSLYCPSEMPHRLGLKMRLCGSLYGVFIAVVFCTKISRSNNGNAIVNW